MQCQDEDSGGGGSDDHNNDDDDYDDDDYGEEGFDDEVYDDDDDSEILTGSSSDPEPVVPQPTCHRSLELRLKSYSFEIFQAEVDHYDSVGTPIEKFTFGYTSINSVMKMYQMLKYCKRCLFC